MKRWFPKKQYGQRWQVETVNSMIKRLLGAALRARTYWSQSREILLRVLTLNVMILRRFTFSTEQLSPFFATYESTIDAFDINIIPPPGASFQLDSITFTPVPEPTTLTLLALGVVGLAVMRRRR